MIILTLNVSTGIFLLFSVLSIMMVMFKTMGRQEIRERERKLDRKERRQMKGGGERERAREIDLEKETVVIRPLEIRILSDCLLLCDKHTMV